MFGKLSTTTAVAAVIGTFGLISSAQAGELWEISNANNNGTFDCRTKPDVHWIDGETHTVGSQGGSEVDHIDPMDPDRAEKLNRRMRQSDHNYDHFVINPNAAKNSCREVRFKFDVADYTVIDGSFGFAGCRYRILFTNGGTGRTHQQYGQHPFDSGW